MNAISQIPIDIIKNDQGFFDPTTPLSQMVNCDHKIIELRENLWKPNQSDNCGRLMPEGTSGPENLDGSTVETVKIFDNVRKITLWVAPAQYDALLAGCNACCV